ncbi:hypothetical protein [Hydrogenophaga defluvii]|uniref:Uncharacterized protein n=1 Tax=Hydrogenophaga defluvii TaxID=249410 RepID=A0ABW2SBP2_9BURK
MDYKQLLTLLLGAVGALGAIFLKEAVQVAMQRRTIAWQLFGYMQTYKAQIMRIPGILPAWNKIKEQEASLAKAYQAGAATFEQEYAKHTSQRTEIRELIRERVVEMLATPTGLGPSLGNSIILAGTRRQLSKAHDLMIESKVFISDRDAALLGPRAAIHVIKFRTSWIGVLSALETLLAITEQDGVHKPEVSTVLVDALVRNGEEALVAVAYLEGISEEMTRKTMISMLRDTW